VRWIAEVTESVTFEGNGAQLVGRIAWITSGGLVRPLDQCPENAGGKDVVLALSPGFLSVGAPGSPSAPANMSVTVRDLTLDTLNSIAWFVSDDGALVLEDVTAQNILSARDSCTMQALTVDGAGADLSLIRNDWNTVLNWGLQAAPPLLTNQAIQSGVAAGDLRIEGSNFFAIGQGGFIDWSGPGGSTVDIVSCRMFEAAGIVVLGELTTNIVNSVWALSDSTNAGADERIINNSSGPMNIIASTVMLGSARCDQDCQLYGADGVVRGYRAGPVNLVQSAIGVNVPADGPGRVIANSDLSATGRISADTDTWIQPVAGQDATALETLTAQPGLLTDPRGLPTNRFGASVLEYVSPLLGTTADPGRLIDVIPDSTCTGANALLDPGTATCIDKDVFGNSRWDTGNERRNIGAVQLTLAPHLSVVGTGDGTVDLGWNRPLDGSGDSVTGYLLRYRPDGSNGAFTEIAVIGPDSLTSQVTGLTNGTTYQFEVSAVRTTAGVGPASNQVTATPYGPIGAPQVTAEGGDGEVRLFWTEPPAGGHPGPLSYTVVYRPAGTTTWLAGPGFLSARITMIPGLDNGTNYEFAVHATTFDQVSGPLGTATATPTSPDTTTTEPSAPTTAPPAPTTAPPAPTTGPSGTLPATGSTSQHGIALAILLILGGSAATIAARRTG
jgi:LPXTG-motif cell wall-anchored protein